MTGAKPAPPEVAVNPATGRPAGAAQIAVLLFAITMPIMGAVLLAPILPSLSKVFPAQAGLVPLLLTAPALTVAITAPFAGAIADRIGRKRLLVGALLAYAVLGTAPLYISSFWGILATRLGVGVTEAAIFTCCIALLSDYFFGRRRSRVFASQNVVLPLGAFVYVILGGVIGQGSSGADRAAAADRRREAAVIIDCHGHFTTAPKAHLRWRADQLSAESEGKQPPPTPRISDDDLREGLEPHQIATQDARGVDLTLFSPHAGQMAHHLGSAASSARWAFESNNLVHRASTLYPGRFAPVCQLPQAPGVTPAACVAELRRCVEELGFVGCNLNPDPPAATGATRRSRTATGTRSTRRSPSSTSQP